MSCVFSSKSWFLFIPGQVGLIIGRGGETIKSLQTRSGARIQVAFFSFSEADKSMSGKWINMKNQLVIASKNTDVLLFK